MPPAAEPAFRDRRWALRAAAWICGAAGLGSVLLATSTLALATMPAGTVDESLPPPPSTATVVLGAVFYLATAAALAAIAVGNLRFRAWAPSVTRVAGWIWLLSGVALLALARPILFAVTTEALGPLVESEPSLVDLTVYISMGLIGIAGVAVPALLLALVSGRHVEATTRAFGGPAPPWLESGNGTRLRLAVSLAAAGVLALPMAFGPAIPLFHVLAGRPWPAVVTVGLMAALLWTARGAARGRPWAWWVALAVILALGVSTWVTFRALPLAGVLAGLGADAWTVETLADLDPDPFGWAALGVTVAGGVYLLRIRHAFRGTR